MQRALPGALFSVGDGDWGTPATRTSGRTNASGWSPPISTAAAGGSSSTASPPPAYRRRSATAVMASCAVPGVLPARAGRTAGG